MNGRKIISIILMFALVITLAVPTTVSAASAFTDVNGHWAESYINKAVNKGFVKGYADGSFKPDNPVTRAEFSKMINSAIGNNSMVNITLKDVPRSEWYYNDVAKAVAATYTSGYDDNTFRPNQSITRQEAACMLARIVPVYGYGGNLKSYPDAASVADWAAEPLQRMTSKQYIGAYSDGKLHPTDSLTRAQTAKIICDVLSKENIVSTNTNVKEETTLKGKIYANNVVLTEDLDDEDADIQNCVILGNLYVRGGGEDTVTIQNSRVANASVEKSDSAVRVLVKGESFVNSLSASKTATIETSGLDGGTFGLGIKNVDIESSAKATLKGTFPKVNVKGAASTMTLASGSIDELNVPYDAKKSDITIESNASVSTATVGCEAYFHGEGTIKKMHANADSITYEKSPKEISIGSGVRTKPTEGNKREAIEFSPEDDATGVSENVKPTITFKEAIETYKGKDIDSDYLEDNIVFKKKNSSGSDIDFTAKINSSDKVITITPEDDLSDDQVYYLAFPTKIFRTKSDEENITAKSVNWTVGGEDADGVKFSPSSGDTGVSVSVEPTITFDSAIETYKGKEIDDDYLEDNIVFREDNSSGTKVKFNASINSKNKIITIEPRSNLSKNQKYYISFASKIFRTESKEKNIPSKSCTFTVGTATPALSNLSSAKTDTTVTLTATPNQSGTIYAVILELSASQPSATQVVAGKNASNTLLDAKFRKSVSVSANTAKALPAFTGLTAGKSYACYAVLKTSSTTSSVAKTTVTTVSNVDVTAINTAITRANSAKSGVAVSTNGSDVYTTGYWVTSTEMAALNAAITTATNAKSTVTSASTASSAAAALDTAVNIFSGAKKLGTKVYVDVSALTSAISAANSAKSGVLITSAGDGADVTSGKTCVTQSTMDALNSAISAAMEVKDAAVSINQVQNAITTLNGAVTIFNSDIIYGTKAPLDSSALASEINRSDRLLDDTKVSTDGSDVDMSEMWAPSEERNEFSSAIDTARSALSSETIQEKIDSAAFALESSRTTFEGKRNNGTKVTSPDPTAAEPEGSSLPSDVTAP